MNEFHLRFRGERVDDPEGILWEEHFPTMEKLKIFHFEKFPPEKIFAGKERCTLNMTEKQLEWYEKELTLLPQRP